LDFYIAFDASDDFDRLAALQFGGKIEVHDRFVDPHAVFVHGAFHVRARGSRARETGKTRHDQKRSKGPPHISSATSHQNYLRPARIDDHEPECTGKRQVLSNRAVVLGTRRESGGYPRVFAHKSQEMPYSV